MVFRLNLSKTVQIERISIFLKFVLLTEIHTFSTSFAVQRVPCIRKEQFCFKDNQEINVVNCSSQDQASTIAPNSIFRNTVSLKSPGIVESLNCSLRILHSFCVLGEYAKSIQAPMENARKISKRIWRICGKYLSVYGEYGKLGFVCGTQNQLRIRGKDLNVFGEYAERIYAYMEKT